MPIVEYVPFGERGYQSIFHYKTDEEYVHYCDADCYHWMKAKGWSEGEWEKIQWNKFNKTYFHHREPKITHDAYCRDADSFCFSDGEIPYAILIYDYIKKGLMHPSVPHELAERLRVAFPKNVFDALKKHVLDHESGELVENVFTHIETLKQHEDSLEELLKDTKACPYTIFYQEDETGGYTDGIFTIEFSERPHKYTIHLLAKEENTGYCQCQEGDEGYSAHKKCSGTSCDWIRPSFVLLKTREVASGSFIGNQQDLWDRQLEWEPVLRSYYEEKKKERVRSLENQLQRIQREISLLEEG
ncbi:hypothetical protein IMZ31_20010 (plasmid) [Pontibacillus sp. ALD_SL1]|uniref:hypothetical protein n=1 Tax=Pontibacillus sp. ALD_SL1 TaxID=2777185 RepID=UPI001A975D7E|nr:hypothetical protein [Pontibacillus sp. ALD_SL1]QST02837.1 hypothetical protein IMZ31_20010 [Pontibacillus sp. ALD_SL1]